MSYPIEPTTLPFFGGGVGGGGGCDLAETTPQGAPGCRQAVP